MTTPRRTFGLRGREAEARHQLRLGALTGGLLFVLCVIWLAGALYGGGRGPVWIAVADWGLTAGAVGLLAWGIWRGSRSAAAVLLLGYVGRKAVLWSSGEASVWSGILPVLLITYGLVQGVRGAWALHAVRVDEARVAARTSRIEQKGA